MSMRYKVTEQYSGRSDIETKIDADRRLKVKVTYRIFESHSMLEEHNQETANNSNTQASSSQSSQGTSTSSLSPFPTAPKPAGMPTSRWANLGKDEKDEKK